MVDLNIGRWSIATLNYLSDVGINDEKGWVKSGKEATADVTAAVVVPFLALFDAFARVLFAIGNTLGAVSRKVVGLVGKEVLTSYTMEKAKNEFERFKGFLAIVTSPGVIFFGGAAVAWGLAQSLGIHEEAKAKEAKDKGGDKPAEAKTNASSSAAPAADDEFTSLPRGKPGAATSPANGAAANGKTATKPASGKAA